MKRKITHSSIRKLQPKQSRYDVYDTALAGFVARVHPTGKISYLLKYNDLAGVRKNYTIGLQGLDGLSASSARDIAEDLKENLKKGIDPQIEKQRLRSDEVNKRQNTLRKYFEGDFKLHLETKKASSQAESRRIVFAEFAELLDKPLCEITPEWVRNWRSTRRKDGLSPHTLKRYNAELDALLAVAVNNGTLDQHPLQGTLKPISAPSRDNIKPRFLSTDEAVKFRAALIERDDHLKGRAESGRQWKIARRKPTDASRLTNRFADHLTPNVLIEPKYWHSTRRTISTRMERCAR